MDILTFFCGKYKIGYPLEKLVSPPPKKRRQNTDNHILINSVDLLLGFFQKKTVPPVLRVSIFLKLNPRISSQLYNDPLEFFYFFALNPLAVDIPPGIPTTFTLPPLKISIDILNKGISIFSGKVL